MLRRHGRHGRFFGHHDPAELLGGGEWQPDEGHIAHALRQPGAFRTGLFTNGSDSAEMDVYSATVGATRRMVAGGDGSQPGAPTKAAAAILVALEAADTPLRLPLGDDAVDAIAAHLDARRQDLWTWEKVARHTGFAD